MLKGNVIGFRPKEHHRRKMEDMAAIMNVSVSEMLRILVENAVMIDVSVPQPMATVSREKMAADEV